MTVNYFTTLITMNKEREERVRKAFEGKPLPYIMEGMIALQTYGNRLHPEYQELVALMNDITLSAVEVK